MKLTPEDVKAYMAGTLLYDEGRNIAKQEILEGSGAPKPVVLAFLLGLDRDLWRGYCDTYKALMA